MEIKEGNYRVADLYPGGFSSLKPSYGDMFTGYRASIGTLGIPTDPRTANILKEVSDKIAPGVRNVEVTMISPEIMESIPKQHLREVRRLAQKRLNDLNITVHGPIVEPSGFGREGWSEDNRGVAERQMMETMEKAYEINPNGDVPVTFHSSGALPAPVYARTKDGEEITEMLAIDVESGQAVKVKKEEKYHPHLKGGEIIKKDYDVNKQIEVMNDSQWDNSLSGVEFQRESAERIIQDVHPMFEKLYLNYSQGNLDPSSVSEDEFNQLQRIASANEYLKDASLKVNSLFDKAYKVADEDGRKHLKKLAEVYEKSLGINGDGKVDAEKYLSPRIQSQALFNLTRGLQGLKEAPQMIKPLNDFAIEHSQKTFGNVAYRSWKKYGDKSPIVSIENPPAWMNAFGRGKDLKNLVEGSKESMVKTLVSNEGMSKSEAQKIADKMIGVTWDTNHINQLRKQGFSKEDVIKETEHIKHLVKHVHLSDGYGFDNAEVPPGMGDSPIKEMLEKLGKKGEQASKIIEAGNYWQHFQQSPIGATFEAMGSPLYSMKMAPYWNQVAGTQGGYFSGYGPTFPQINYETFGGSFSRLPSELGGQVQQRGGSRLGGTPME